MYRRLIVLGAGVGMALALAPPAAAPGYLMIGDEVVAPTRPRQLTTGLPIVSYAMSPDGRWIACLAGEREVWRHRGADSPPLPLGASQLFIVPTQGDAARLLAAIPAERQDPPLRFVPDDIGGVGVAWSPDSQWVAVRVTTAVSSAEAPRGTRFLITHIARDEQHWITSGSRWMWWRWHRDAPILYYLEGEPGLEFELPIRLVAFDCVTRQHRTVTDLGMSYPVRADPDWNDPESFALVSRFLPTGTTNFNDAHLARTVIEWRSEAVSREDLGPASLHEREFQYEVVRSPDGRFEAQYDVTMERPPWIEVRETASGQTLATLREDAAWHVGSTFAWSPDSTMLAFLRSQQLRDTERNLRHQEVWVLWVFQPDYGERGHLAPMAVFSDQAGVTRGIRITPPMWTLDSRSVIYPWGGALWRVDLVPAAPIPEVMRAAGLRLTDEQKERLVLSSLTRITSVAWMFYNEAGQWPTVDEIYREMFKQAPTGFLWNQFGDPEDPYSRLLVWLLPPTAPPPYHEFAGTPVPMAYISFPEGRVCVVFYAGDQGGIRAMSTAEWEELVRRAKAEGRWPPDWE